jgi:hypothetical protein
MAARGAVGTFGVVDMVNTEFEALWVAASNRRPQTSPRAWSPPSNRFTQTSRRALGLCRCGCASAPARRDRRHRNGRFLQPRRPHNEVGAPWGSTRALKPPPFRAPRVMFPPCPQAIARVTGKAEPLRGGCGKEQLDPVTQRRGEAIGLL